MSATLCMFKWVCVLVGLYVDVCRYLVDKLLKSFSFCCVYFFKFISFFSVYFCILLFHHTQFYAAIACVYSLTKGCMKSVLKSFLSVQLTIDIKTKLLIILLSVATIVNHRYRTPIYMPFLWSWASRADLVISLR